MKTTKHLWPLIFAAGLIVVSACSKDDDSQGKENVVPTDTTAKDTGGSDTTVAPVTPTSPTFYLSDDTGMVSIPIDRMWTDSSYERNADLIPQRVVKGKPMYSEVFDGTDWQNIMMKAGDGKSLFGSSTADVLEHPDKYAVKFDIYVPKAYSLKGVVLGLGFTSDYDWALDAPRRYSAEVNFNEITWNKDASVMWSVASVASFYTDRWITVSVPLTEFKWNIALKSYLAYAQNLIEDNWSDAKSAQDAASDLYGDGNSNAGPEPNNHVDYFTYWKNNGVTAAEYSKKFGGLAIWYSSVDAIRTDSNFLLAISNIRIAANNSVGTKFLKLDWGKASN